MRIVALILSIVLILSGGVHDINVACAENDQQKQRSDTFLTTLLSKPVFIEGEPHIFTLDFKLYFKAMCATRDACTLSIQKDIYEQAQAQTLWEIVMEDLQTLSATTGIPLEAFQAHTVYVVEKTPNDIERFGNRVYCRTQDIESGAYRIQLICAALGTEVYWKGAGLTGYVFGEKVDEDALKVTYEQISELDILSLFISYFIGAFASEEELLIAKQTAISVCGYVIKNYGIEAFLKGDCTAYKQEWLKMLGVDRDYNDPYCHILKNYRFKASSQYPLIATTSHEHVIYIKKMYDLRTATDVRLFLYDIGAGAEALFELIAMQAPEYLDTITERYENPMRVYCGNEQTSYANLYAREIQLKFGYGYFHELGHILFPTTKEDSYYSQMWQYEGICNYLSYGIYPTYSLKKEYLGAFGIYAAPYDDDMTANQKFFTRVIEIYLNNADMPTTIEDFNVALFFRAMAQAPFRYEELKDSVWTWPISNQYTSLNNTKGNELSNTQAFCFATYLIDQYSLSEYLDYCLKDTSFEAVFGMNYEDAKEAWLEALINEVR